MSKKIAIIGSGPAGLTAAIYTARAGVKSVVFSGRLPGGLLTWTGKVENFPGFPDGIDGIDLMTSMQEQAEKFGAEIDFDEIKSIETGKYPEKHKVRLSNDKTLEFDAIILAMGSNPKTLGLPAEERLRGKGVSNCATCDGAFFKNVPVVVAGGGDSAMEEAIYLTRFASMVHLVHRRDKFKASEIMVKRAIGNPKITVHLNSVVKDIAGNDHVEKVVIENIVSGELQEIPCRGFFGALGHIPNTTLVAEIVKLDASGCIIVNTPETTTDIPGIFAAGDCTDPIYRQAITAAGSGCKAAMDAIRYLENGD